ncbi:hypothetical protein TIFTF001_036611 [Ficus carica]|uniref:Uncharacterized protein n=1 Tax=Ficus carica TaxID=3494 RepID=A0AA88JCY0_FICCA|nr:hypothetical protein TIFTF001_036600 [Ficus carica]GMN67551.1 hypothetical protein TIFTF001_036611 [Ficus carica]
MAATDGQPLHRGQSCHYAGRALYRNATKTMPQLDFWPTKAPFGSRVQIGAEYTPNPHSLCLHEKHISFGERESKAQIRHFSDKAREREATNTMAATNY